MLGRRDNCRVTASLAAALLALGSLLASANAGAIQQPLTAYPGSPSPYPSPEPSPSPSPSPEPSTEPSPSPSPSTSPSPEQSPSPSPSPESPSPSPSPGCQPGFGEGSLSKPCVPCKAGEFSAGGANKCVPCPVDTFAPRQSASCTPCPVHTTTDGSLGAPRCLPVCPAGTRSTRNGCRPCAAGEFSTGGVNSVCQKCPADTYASGRGNFKCTPCPAQTSTNGTRGATAASSCQPSCPPGQGVSSRGCSMCWPGQFSPGGLNAKCEPCPVDTYSPEDIGGAVQCSPCGSGSTTNGATGATECQAVCPAGQAFTPEGCKPCPAGQFSAGGLNAKCEVCPADTYAGPGSASCTPCPEKTTTSGRTGVADAKQCEPVCPAGSGFAPEGCKPCPAGQFSAGGANANCEACPVDTFSAAEGTTKCDACPAGTNTNDATGATKCEPVCPAGQGSTPQGCKSCPAGMSSAGGVNVPCVPCPVDTFSAAEGSAKCDACPASTSTNGATGATECVDAPEVCDPGFGATPEGCKPCPPGQSFPGGQDAACTPCPVDTFAQAAQSAKCEPCPAGTSTNGVIGANKCDPPGDTPCGKTPCKSPNAYCCGNSVCCAPGNTCAAIKGYYGGMSYSCKANRYPCPGGKLSCGSSCCDTASVCCGTLNRFKTDHACKPAGLSC